MPPAVRPSLAPAAPRVHPKAIGFDAWLRSMQPRGPAIARPSPVRARYVEIAPGVRVLVGPDGRAIYPLTDTR